MANHEIYIGGPATANYSRAMFPAPPFNADSDDFTRVTPSAHKGPTAYNLARVLDFAQEAALRNYVSEATIVGGDAFGAILFPQNCVITGFAYEVETPSAGPMVLSLALRGAGAVTFPDIDCAVASKGYARPAGVSWLTTPVSVTGSPIYLPEPDVLDLTLDTLADKADIGPLRLLLVPMVSWLYAGQY